MATNLAINGDLIVAAVLAGHHKTKKEAVTAALKEYVQRRKQMEVLELEGELKFARDYDYKKLRRAR